ncbi:MAG: hypothetical protein ACKOZW_01590 [Cyanobium sp.]
MTDAPTPAAAAPAPTARRRGTVSPRPDDRLVLLEAIQRRDGPAVRRLAERWVHRRGLASLAAFERQDLVAAEPETSRWFADLLQEAPPLAAPPHLASGAAALGPEIRLEDLALGTPSSSLPSVEEAFAALAAEFAPSSAELDHIASGGLDQVEACLLPPPPASLSFTIAPAASAGEASLAEAPAEPSGSEHTPGPAGPWFGRVRGLLRTCVDEVMGSLRPATAPASSPVSAPTVEPMAVGAGVAVATSEAVAASPAVAANEDSAEPLAPWPAFHPTASILAALPDPPAQAPTPTPARWLPRLGLVPPAPRPAPAPADLADLRAWLPDAADDLPRAC